MNTERPYLSVLSPAKINICLKIVGKLPNGYHELFTIIVPVGIYDRLDFKLSKFQSIRLFCDDTSIPSNHENLVFKAAEAFYKRIEMSPSVDISLYKRIPSGAGLGGGSSNAAVTLMSLNRLYENILSDEDLFSEALKLGADVPFFLDPAPSIGTGVGEMLEKLPIWPMAWYLIVKPLCTVSTAWAYNNFKLRLTPNTANYILKNLKKNKFTIPELLYNDLESVTIDRFPELAEIKAYLIKYGAEGALMTGSGSAVFGVFPERKSAMIAAEKIRHHRLGHLFVVPSI